MDRQADQTASLRRQCAKQLSEHHLVIRLFFVYSNNICLSKTYQMDNMPQQFILYETAEFLYEFLEGEKSDIFSVDGNTLCFVDLIARKKREFRIPLDRTVMDHEKSVKIQLKRINYRLKLLMETASQKEQELVNINRTISIKTAENEAIKLNLVNLTTAYNEMLQVAEEQLSNDLKSDNYLRGQIYINEKLKKRMKELERQRRQE